MKWIDTLEIVLALEDAHPDADPLRVNFVELRDWIVALDGFDDDVARCGERILEAIQMAWIEERDG
ncbi:MAG: Fe-S cluster assembly protein IscX [Gammaproteobacteria bacterium]|nr:Fe-S cluster assembly protein IscX [Gammaproteobacteria bacterium]